VSGTTRSRSARFPALIALPWVHRLFSNLKRWGRGVYHGLRKTNLQHYLDEFVSRFNRRRTRHAAFDTLLGFGARTTPAPSTY
jgi:ISXO2-like transposase domain